VSVEKKKQKGKKAKSKKAIAVRSCITNHRCGKSTTLRDGPISPFLEMSSPIAIIGL
jgi:hypothetical protein